MSPELEMYRSVVPSGLETVVGSLSSRKDALVCFVKYLKTLQAQKRQDLGDLPFKVALARRVLCLVCNKVSIQVPHDIIPSTKKPTGKGCAVCAGNSPEASKERYLETLERQNAEDADPSVPFGNHTGRRILCRKCGNIRIRLPHNVSTGHGCPICTGQDHLTSQNKYLEELRKQNRKDIDDKPYLRFSKRWILCTVCNKEAEQCVSNIINAPHHGCPNCSWKVSKKEEAVRNFILAMYPDATHNQKKLLRNHNFELDIYIPSIKKAVEFDGEFWHKSEWAIDHGAPERDAAKEAQCKEAGIRLLRIEEKDFDQDPGAVFTRVKAFLVSL